MIRQRQQIQIAGACVVGLALMRDLVALDPKEKGLLIGSLLTALEARW